VHPSGVEDTARARRATWALFAVTGLLAATWASRMPAVQDRLELSPGGLAVVVLGLEGGALAGLPVGAALVGRLGSRGALSVAVPVFAPGLVAAALAPTLGWLVAAVAIWAAANSVVDVALNAQGVELEARAGRPVLSGLHSGQGAGLLCGAAAGTAAAALDLPLPVHAAVVGVAGLLVALPVTAALVREPRRAAARGPRTRPHRRLAPLGAVAFCVFLLDGAATTWLAVHLRSAHDTGAGPAAAGYLGFAAALVLGRLAGDRLTARTSRRAVVRGCALGTAAGVACAVLAPGVVGAVAGWVLTGLALGPLAPTVLGAAPAIGGASAPRALAAVTTVGYLGSFSGPPVVGLLAERWDLPGALLLLVVAGLVAAGLSSAALRSPGPEPVSRPSRRRPAAAGRRGRCWPPRRTRGAGPAAGRGR
jgi:MFS family permease